MDGWNDLIYVKLFYAISTTCTNKNMKMKKKITVNILKFRTLLFLFSNKILVSRAGTDKMLVRVASREDPDQTAASEAV